MNDALHELSDALSLRDCAQDQHIVFADQHELFQLTPRTPGCIRLEVKKRLGPCVAACTAAQYQAQVDLARAFLDGTNDGPIAQLRSEMDACAERLNFERAAVLRDKLQRLETLREMFARMRFAVETLSFTYAVPGHAGDDRVYIIRRGTVRGEAPAPRTARDRARLLTMVGEVFDPPERSSGAVPTHEIDELLLLSSWFRRNPGELEPPGASRVALRSLRRAQRAQCVTQRAVASNRPRLSRLRTRAARADWPATCTCASLRPTDAERRIYQRSGRGMATTGQPKMLVQCVSLKPWLAYPGWVEPGGGHDLTLGRMDELLGIEADGAFYRISDDSGGDFSYPVSPFASCSRGTTKGRRHEALNAREVQGKGFPSRSSRTLSTSSTIALHITGSRVRPRRVRPR